MFVDRKWALLAAISLILLPATACNDRSGAPASSATAGVSAVPVLEFDAAGMRTAVEEALAIPDRLERVTRLTTLWHNLTLDNLDGAIQVFDENVRRSDPLELRLFANAWAHLDPAGASQKILSWRYVEAMQGVQDEIFLTWVLDRGASEPMAWAEENIVQENADQAARGERQNTPSPILSAVLKAIVLNGGSNEEITPLIEPYPQSQVSNSVLLNTVLQLRAQGPDRLRSWLESIPMDADNHLSSRAWKTGLSVEIRTDVDRAREWFEAREEQLTGLDVLPRVAQGLSGKDKLQGIEWVVDRPESEERTAIFRGLIDGWFRDNANAAAAWVEAHLETPIVHEIGLGYLTVYVLRTDVEKAVSYAEQLPEKQKPAAMKQCLVAWGRRDINGLKKYLDSHDVPDEIRSIVNIEHGTKLKALESQSGQEE